MSTNDNSLLLEIEEAMRRERLEEFLKKNGRFILALAGAIVLGTALASGWHAWNDSVRVRDTDHLVALLGAKDFPDNIKPEALKMRAPLRGMALLNGAGKYYEDGKVPQALALYKQAANDTSIPGEIRELASLMTARIIANDPKSTGDVRQLLAPVLNDRASPWHAYALLDVAAWTAHKNDYKQAREDLARIIQDASVPASLQNKARALDQVYATRELQQGKQKTDQRS